MKTQEPTFTFVFFLPNFPSENEMPKGIEVAVDLNLIQIFLPSTRGTTNSFFRAVCTS